MQSPARTTFPPVRRALSTGVVLIALLGLVWPPGPAAAAVGKGEWKQARAELLDYFENRKIVAKLPLKNHAKYYVTADGEPAGKQGKRLGVPTGDLAAQPGDEVWLAFALGKGDRINLVAYCCKNRKRKQKGIVLVGSSFWARFFVELGREGRPEDLHPEKVARALSGFFEIDGFDPNAALAGAVAALEQTAPPAPEPELAPPGPATLLTLAATASPESLRIGETVRLRLEYQVGGASSSTSAVVETRTVSFNGAPLPGYPVSEEVARGPGRHASTLPQLIPQVATPGLYEFRGEVCVGGDCISRTTVFRVEPR